MRVKLYPSNLPAKEGKLFARRVHEQILSYEDVCTAAKKRGGFTGNLDDLKNHVAVFLREVVYQLCDGYGVDFGGLFEVFLSVLGDFENEYEPVDKEKHQTDVHFKMLSALHERISLVEVVCEGLADSGGYIAEIRDAVTDSLNGIITKGGIFYLFGDKIKVAGNPDDTGVYFFAPGSPDVSIKVTAKLGLNNPTRIIGIVPDLPPGKDWFVEVRTNYSSNNQKPLKAARTIRSPFTVRLA
jgi:hypothetical protein